MVDFQDAVTVKEGDNASVSVDWQTDKIGDYTSVQVTKERYTLNNLVIQKTYATGTQGTPGESTIGYHKGTSADERSVRDYYEGKVINKALVLKRYATTLLERLKESKEMQGLKVAEGGEFDVNKDGSVTASEVASKIFKEVSSGSRSVSISVSSCLDPRCGNYTPTSISCEFEGVTWTISKKISSDGKVKISVQERGREKGFVLE